jgi:hypothetical protein
MDDERYVTGQELDGKISNSIRKVLVVEGKTQRGISMGKRRGGREGE